MVIEQAIWRTVVVVAHPANRQAKRRNVTEIYSDPRSITLGDRRCWWWVTVDNTQYTKRHLLLSVSKKGHFVFIHNFYIQLLFYFIISRVSLPIFVFLADIHYEKFSTRRHITNLHCATALSCFFILKPLCLYSELLHTYYILWCCAITILYVFNNSWHWMAYIVLMCR